jgi:xanthine dehydrogenase accessory factor
VIQRLLEIQLEFTRIRQPYALATVVEITGSSSAKPGAKALLDKTGQTLAGWIGGGCAQSMVARQALDCLSSGEPCVIDIDLNDEIFGAGMPCGGAMRVFVEPILPKPQLWLAGNGLIAETVCELAHRTGFEVVVNDSQATEINFPTAKNIVNDDDRYRKLLPNPGDFVVIANHHKGDYLSLNQALQSEAAYIGLVSSHKRAELIKDRFAKESMPQEAIKRIRAPAGLDLGAKTPQEIALAIVSEMVLIRRGGHGGTLCKT